MKHPELKVEKRTVFGRKLKKLRKEGILPANVYGKGVTSTAVQIQEKDFEKMFKEVGETGIIDVTIDGEKRPVLIKNIAIDSLSRKILHADLYQVNLKEKIKSMVPLVIVGEPKAVTEKVGLLMHTLSEVEVEALPEELPENIEVPVEHLAQVDEQVTVGDLKVVAGVEILTDKEQVVAKIAELVSKEAEEQAAADAAAAEAAKAEAGAEGAEGAPAAEGEAATTEGAPTPEEKTEAAKPEETK